MKLLLGVLFLVNAALLGYFYMKANQPTVVFENRKPIMAEKIVILTPEALEAMPKKEVKVAEVVPEPTVTVITTPEPVAKPVVASACYAWGSFTRQRAKAARRVLNKLKVKAALKKEASKDTKRYWIYHPALKSEKAAKEKAEEVKKLGVLDLFVVKEPKFKNAISFGVFKDETLAIKLATELQLKGIPVVKGVRNQEQGQVSFLTKEIPADIVTKLEENRPSFPGSEIRQAVCAK